MKNTKKNLMNNFKQGVAKSLGKVASRTGDAAIDSACLGFIYEPKVPKELLMSKTLKK